MDFLKNVRDSIYGPVYYASLKDKPLSYSIKYFILLAVWLAVIASVVFLFPVVPVVNSFLENASQKVVAYYPDNLQVTVASGSVSTNVTEPYFLQLPDELKTSLASSSSYGISSSSPENLLVIDTKDPITVSEFQGDRTFVLLASDSVAYTKDQSMVVQPIGSNVSMKINKAAVVSFVGKVRPYFRLIDWAIAILMPIGIFLGMIFRLIYLFFLALLIWAVMGIKKVGGGYKQAYRWGLHLMTLPMILGIALWVIVPGVNIPFLFTVITLIVAAVNLKNVSSAVSSTLPTV
jgi:hypothetical protein